MPCNSKHFGITVSRLRIAKGCTQEQLSALAGISRSHLAMLESGKKIPRLDTFFNIAWALNMTATELMRMTEEAEKGALQ